ncbi:cytochrome c3 family protein [Mailhella massiliensis]|uniref:cytochrome c3 family protein n=1 Tax=Mailhella massiliensis TaxID=1903261 RepID=UPI00097CE6CA|nr:cytochrome c3 family protein [Mailhella massiliensis]
MKKLLTFGSAALIVAALALPAGAAQFAHIPAGPIKMELTEKPVYFDHNIHTTQDCTACHASMPAHFPPLAVDTEKQCAVCHHKVAGTTPKFKCGTAGCHNPEDKQAERSYFKIVHDREIFGKGHVADSCLGCHTEVAKTRPEKKQALTGCAGSACHPKQK